LLPTDVSKNWLDICIYSTIKNPIYNRYSNDESGHAKFLDSLKDERIKLLVCEPTGGYEQLICQKLSGIYSIHRVNTYSFKLFAKSINLSKTDKEDAFKLAYYGERMQLEANYLYLEEVELLKRYQQRREDLVGMLSNEKKRLHHSVIGIDKESVEQLIKFLETSIAAIDDKLNEAINNSSELKAKVEILESVPGIGRCLASKLVSFLPELGCKNYNSNELSAIVGVAPYARDSGVKSGKRFTRGGRKIPRDALYMAVLSGRKKFKFLGVLYQRLIGKFKPKKVAIVACMRRMLDVCHKLLKQKKMFVENL
jgi:transposase